MLVGLLAPALFVLMTAWAINAIVAAVTLPKKAVSAPSCERCKYPVAGLGTLNCPECGTDLRATGIITRAMEVRRRGSLASAILAWTVLCAIGAMVVSSIVGTFWAMSIARNPANATTFATSSTLTPASGAHSPVVIKAIQTVPLRGTAPTTAITLTIPTGTGGTFTASAATPALALSWTKSDGASASVTTLDRASVLEWFTLAGIDTSPPEISNEADELVAALSALARAPTAPVASSASWNATASAPIVTGLGSGFSNDPAYYVWATVLLSLGALIWGLGIWLIVRRRRKMLKVHAA